MTIYRIIADLLLSLHAAFIAFVILGQLLVMAGLVMKWKWVRNFSFRVIHLAAIGYVVVQTWLGMECPLTTWENDLRIKAGQEPYSDNGLIADCIHRVCFFEAETWVFHLCYSLFGLAVLVTFLLAPPRRKKKAGEQRPLPLP